MMSEEDEVFLPVGENSTAPELEYTQIYGHDDVLTNLHRNHTVTNGNQEQNHTPTSSCQDNDFEDLDVIINNPRFRVKTIRRKKSSQRSESSEDDILEYYNGAAKPLMYPRQRPKNQLTLRQRRCIKCCWYLLYLLLIAGGLSTFAFVIVYLVRNYADQWFNIQTPGVKKLMWQNQTVVGCTEMSVEKVWVTGIPKLMTESSFRLVDVNKDGVLDILFGFATGAEGYKVPELVCDIYFNGSHPCLGGVLALDGVTGTELWRHYAPHEIFAINCNQDMDLDQVKDCLIAGRVGSFEAVSGRDGHLLWNFTHPARISDMNVYSAQFVRDLDGDGSPDIINIHGGDPFGEPGSETRLTGRIFVFSGRDGRVLQWVDVPDGRESYYSPVLYQRRDGTDVVLFGTGGETHPGSLWYILLDDLYKGDIQKAKEIIHNPFKGFMTPPILLDLTADGVPDLVFASYNSTVMAFNGESYEMLWNFTYPMSETYATPAPGYYNEDDVPDFMIHWQYGPGFPIYYHSVTTILDGRDGTAILVPYIKSSVGSQASPTTVSVEGFGNDLFLFWYADCLGHAGIGGDFKFVKGTNVHEQSRSDVCRLRFKTEGFSKLYALSSHLKSPGLELYNSEKNKAVEHSVWVNTTVEAIDFLKKHPEHLDNYNVWNEWVKQNILQKEATSVSAVKVNPSGEDAREHLRHSLALITGQLQPDNQAPLIKPQQINHQDNQKLPDIFQKDVPSDYSNEGIFQQSKSAWESPKKNSNDYAIDRDSEDDDDYLKLLYDALEKKKPDSTDYLQRYIDNGLGHQDEDNNGLDGGRWRGKKRKRRKMRRERRHVGPHDEGGLQRLISTGTLAPPLLLPTHPDYANSMDVVFATYWFYPAKTEAILPEDQYCIDQRMQSQAERFDPNSIYFGMDDDAFGHVVTKECLELSKHQLPEDGIYSNQHTYNPYNVHMGQLTVYRMRLKCKCKKLSKNQRCSRVLPYSQQQWSAYMGSDATSHWRPLHNHQHTFVSPHDQ